MRCVIFRFYPTLTLFNSSSSLLAFSSQQLACNYISNIHMHQGKDYFDVHMSSYIQTSSFPLMAYDPEK